jgi:hypothetical protein
MSLGLDAILLYRGQKPSMDLDLLAHCLKVEDGAS